MRERERVYILNGMILHKCRDLKENFCEFENDICREKRTLIMRWEVFAISCLFFQNCC
jgi:hypothetical protein